MKYIGKKYVPSDNSYTKNLTGNRNYYLAGNLLGDIPKETTIVSEPYKETIEIGVFSKQEKECFFIDVKYKKDTLRVLFYEKNVDRDLQSAIDQNEQHRQMNDYHWDL